MLYVHLDGECIWVFINGASDLEDVLMHASLKRESGFPQYLINYYMKSD